MFNKVVLVGILSSDPELHHLEGKGVAVANFTLTVERPYTSKISGRRDEDVIDITVWRNQAEKCAEYLKKDSRAAIVGRLQIDTRQDKEGNSYKRPHVIADNVQFLPDSFKSGLPHGPKDTVKQTNKEVQPQNITGLEGIL